MMRRNPFTLFIHLALVIIVAGALCTCFGGIQGEVTIADSASVTSFTKTSGPGDGTFPFNVTLVRVDVTFYPGTTTPMDFNSTLRIDGREYEVSMNNPVVVDGWRFYQSGMSADSSTFSVSHDPWGIGLTYIGYILGTVGLMGFFFQKKTAWRLLLKKRTVAALLLSAFTSSADAAELPAM